jgi:uncharacterized damage-inducible protein DinB
MSYIESIEDVNTDSLLLEKEKIIIKKKKLIEAVKHFSRMEYLEIFNIFKEDGCSYTENINGVFINLNNVPIHTIDKIFHFLDYIKSKKEELLIHEEKMNETKNLCEKMMHDTQETIKYTKYMDKKENDTMIETIDFSSDEEESQR